MSQNQFSSAFDKFLKCSNWKEVIEKRIESFDRKDFFSIETALIIGCGSGMFEIPFLQKITPNLKSATFIEASESCFEELQKNTVFFKKKVSIKTCLCRLQDWETGREKFDLVVMCNCLYHFPDIKSVLDMCFDQFLKTKGLLYVEIVDDVIQSEPFYCNLLSLF